MSLPLSCGGWGWKGDEGGGKGVRLGWGGGEGEEGGRSVAVDKDSQSEV